LHERDAPVERELISQRCSYELLDVALERCLSYQVYLSADMMCYEGKGVPVDIKLLNKKADIENGIDPLITRAWSVEVKERGSAGTMKFRPRLTRPGTCTAGFVSYEPLHGIR
jgi:hypothetical protein